MAVAGAAVQSLRDSLTENFDSLPSSIRAAVPVMQSDAIKVALDLFSNVNGDPRFRVHFDESCGMPSDWRDRWRTCNISRSASRIASESKYVADAYIFHMLAVSPFVVSNWRRANASVVVLLPRDFGGA